MSSHRPGLIVAALALVALGAPGVLVALAIGGFVGTPVGGTHPETAQPIARAPGDVRVLRQEALAADGETWTFYGDLLRRALERTVDDSGPFAIVLVDKPMEQGRSLRSVAEGGPIDVTWTMTSRDREARLRPVRIPLLRGLLGYRLLLVSSARPDPFDEVRDVEGLAAWTAGQGIGWPDVAILEANGLPVTTGYDFEGLFGMLRRGRFDYFPRGLTEAWGEVEGREDVVVEPRLLLRYTMPIYFFVHSDDQPLAARLERGLRALQADGTHQAMIDDRYGAAIAQSHIEDRMRFELENPGLPAATPLGDDTLWFRGDRVEARAP